MNASTRRPSFALSNTTLLAALAGSLAGIASAQPGTNLCPTDCSPNRQIQICYEAGRVDNYAAPVDPTTPRPAFASLLSTYAISKPFDDSRVNAVCGTTFQNLPCGITSAILEVQMRAENDIPQNDSIYLQWLGSTFAWGSNISALPGAGGTWNAGQQQTFTINLGSLSGGLINQMNMTHALDMLVSDDTTVEHARLTITVCPCDGPPRIYTVGIADNLALPTEPTSRRARLTALRTTSPYLWKDNDDSTIDRGWGNTFINLPSGIVRADFNILMKPSAGGAGNDGLAFDLLNLGAPEAFSRAFNINTIAPPWTTNPLTNFYFNLGSTLPSTVCGTNLLGDFGDRTFDVYVQDDTAIDAARLRVWPCPPLRRIFGFPIELLGTAQVQQTPVGTTQLVFDPTTGQDEVRFDAHGTEGQTFQFVPGAFSHLPVGTELTISLLGDVTGDGELVAGTGRGHGKVSIQDFNIMRVAPGPNGTGTCTGIHIRNRTTGQSVDACLSGADALDIFGTDIDTIGWREEGGRHTPFHNKMHIKFRDELTMRLPDGRIFRGDSIDIDDDQLADNPRPEVCSFSWATTDATTPPGPVGLVLASVSSVVNDVEHTAVGPSCVLSTNLGSVTVGNIGSSGQDGVEVKLGAVASFTTNISPVCGDDLGVACADQPIELKVSATGNTADGTTVPVCSTRISGRLCCFFDIFPDFSSGGTPGGPVVATVLDDSGIVIGHIDVPAGGSLRVTTNGTPIRSVGTHTIPVNGAKRSEAKLTLRAPVSIGNQGTPALVGTEIVFTLADPAASSADSISSVTITGSGMQEFDLTEQTVEPLGSGSNCYADFNQDGGIDGGDVDAFFEAWSAGDASADTNEDGGVDGADVDTFFAQWSAGGC